MPTYHRSQRLRLVGTGPKVEQLQEGRFRLTFTCTATNPNEAWMNGNKDQIMTAYGTLQSAQKNIAGIDPRTDEAYSDMVLFRTEANPSERDLIITLVYETATTAFVKAQDDKIDFELNGLKRVTRVTIAKTGTNLPSTTIGSTTLSQSETDLKLASKSVEENDAFIQITEVYLEQGTVSESIDNVGSQLAKVITTFGADPDTPGDYVLASKEESNFAGYQTNTFRFLKENVMLSRSLDESRADKPEVIEYFKPAASRLQAYDENTNPGGIPTGKVLDKKDESNVDGIPTERYTFRKDGAVLSQNWDKIGSQQAVVITKYNSDPTSADVENFTGDSELTYVIARKVKNGRERTFTFMEVNALLSVSEEKVGSQNAIVNEIFKPTDESNIPCKDVDGNTINTHTEADRTESDHDGIKTVRVRFLKNNAILSTSEDLIGSQKAIIIEKFGNTAPAITDDDVNSIDLTDGYIIANKQESSVDGIKTFRYTFLQEDKVLSKSVDNESPLLTEVLEVFKPDASRASKDDYVLTNKTESNVNGIPTERYTFKKTGVILSQSHELVGSQEAVVISKFGSAPTTGEANTFGGESYTIAKKEESGTTNQKTFTYTFLQNNVTLSISEDLVGSQKAIVIEKFGSAAPVVDDDANTVGTQVEGVDFTGYSIAKRDKSNLDGIETYRYTYLKDDVVLSRSKDSVGSQKAVVLEVFNGDNEVGDANSYGDGADYVLAREEESNVDGVKTRRYTYLEPSILSVEESKNTPENRITVRVFDLASDDTSVSASSGAVVSTTSHILVSQSDQDYAGIKTSVYVFESKDYNTKTTNEFGRTVIDRVEQSSSDFSLDNQSAEETIDGVSNLRILNQTIENNDNDVNKKITKYTTVGIDDVKEDIVGSQKAIIITKVGAEPTTSEAAFRSDVSYASVNDFSIARKDNAREGGLDVYTYTFLLNNTILSETEDRKGSLKTNVIEVFNPNVTIPGIRVDGGQNVTGEYFKTASLVFGKNMYKKVGNYYNMQIMWSTTNSRWEFNTAGTVYAHNSDLNPDNSLDPPNTEWTADTTAGGQGQDANEVYNLDFTEFDTTLPSTSQGLDTSHRYDKDGYSLINLQKSAVDGIPTMRYTFAKDNSVISVSEDKLGAQKAIVNEIFNPTSETITGVDSDNTALAGYTEVDRTESDYDGIKTIRVRFLKNDSVLSVSEDFIGSQKAVVNEVFNPHQDGVSGKDTNNQALSGYSEADRTESNYNGIKTIRVRFLKDNVTLSQTEDYLGSQKRIVKEVFNPLNGQISTPLGGFIQASKETSNVQGTPTIRFSFLKPSILSVSQDFAKNVISVQAFDRTLAEVRTALDEVTTNHKLVAQQEQNHDGIVTQTYQFELDESDVIEFMGDDRLKVNRTIYQAHDYDYDALTVGSSTATVNGTLVTLVSLQVEKEGTTSDHLTRLRAVYVQPKIISIAPILKSEYNDTPMYQYRSLVSSPKAINDALVAATTPSRIDDPNGTDIQANAVFAEPNVNNTSSPVVFTQNVLNTSVNLAASGSSALISSHEDFYDFQMPGLITLSFKKFGREKSDNTSQYDYNKINIETRKIAHPITTKVKCSVFNFIQRGSTITDSDYKYAAAQGLWSPDGWAAINMKISKEIYGFDQVDVPINNTYPGYRIEGSSRQQAFKRKTTSGFSTLYHPAHIVYNGIDMGSSFQGMKYELNIVNNGPPNPERKRWCLNVDIQPAFRDTAGNQYYNKQIVVTERIPTRTNGSLIYN